MTNLLDLYTKATAKAENIQWQYYGWPSEQAWISAGKPSEQYGQWLQRSRQEEPQGTPLEPSQFSAGASAALPVGPQGQTGRMGQGVIAPPDYSGNSVQGSTTTRVVQDTQPEPAPITPFNAGLDPSMIEAAQRRTQFTAGAGAALTPEAAARNEAQSRANAALGGLGGPFQGVSDAVTGGVTGAARTGLNAVLGAPYPVAAPVGMSRPGASGFQGQQRTVQDTITPIPELEAAQEGLEGVLNRVPVAGPALGLASELIVPTTPLELPLIPSSYGLAGDIADIGRIGGGLANAGRAAVRQAVTPEPNVLRVAVREGAVTPVQEAGLAASRGAVNVADPSGVRILGPDEALQAGEREMFHGTAGQLRGTALEPGAFLTPVRQDAETFARSASIMGRQEAGPLRRLVGAEEGMIRLSKPESWDDIQKGWITPEGKLVQGERTGWNHEDIARRTLGLESETAALEGGFVRFRADPTGIVVEGADPTAVKRVARMYARDRSARISWDVGAPSTKTLTRENSGSATVGDILAGRAGPTDPNTGAFIDEGVPAADVAVRSETGIPSGLSNAPAMQGSPSSSVLDLGPGEAGMARVPLGPEDAGRGADEVAGTLYHGMREPFDGPLELRSGRNSTIFGDEGVNRPAVFLSESRDAAADFGGTPHVGAFKLKPGTKVLDLTDGGFPLDVENALIEQGWSPQALYGANPIWEMFDSPEFVASLRELGYGAARYGEESPQGIRGVTTAVFDPSNVTRLDEAATAAPPSPASAAGETLGTPSPQAAAGDPMVAKQRAFLKAQGYSDADIDAFMGTVNVKTGQDIIEEGAATSAVFRENERMTKRAAQLSGVDPGTIRPEMRRRTMQALDEAKNKINQKLGPGETGAFRTPGGSPQKPRPTSVGTPPKSAKDLENIKATEQYLRGGGTKALPPEPGPGISYWDEAWGALGLPRTLTASLDLGALTRQGQRLGWADPAAWKAAARDGIASLLSEDTALAARAVTESNPWHDFADSVGLKFYDWGDGIKSGERAPQFVGLNESWISSKAQDVIPWLRPSERAHATFLNTQGMQVFSKYAQNMWDSGIRDVKAYQDLATVVNHARGYGTGKLTDILASTQTMFSARNATSLVESVFDPFTKSGSLFRPSARQLAAKSLASMVTGQTSMLGFLGVTGAMSGLWSVNANPLDSDFGKIKIGNTRIDTLGGYSPLIRLVARIGAVASDKAGATENLAPFWVDWRSELVRYFRNKLDPKAGLVASALVGEDYKGDPFKLDEGVLADMVLPMIVMSAAETVSNNRGANKALLALTIPAETIGLGSSTYETPTEARNRVAQGEIGEPYDNLSPIEQAGIDVTLGDDLAEDQMLKPWKQADDWAFDMIKARKPGLSYGNVKASDFEDLYDFQEAIRVEAARLLTEQGTTFESQDLQAQVTAFMRQNGISELQQLYRRGVIAVNPQVYEVLQQQYNDRESDFPPPKYAREVYEAMQLDPSIAGKLLLELQQLGVQ